MDKHKRHIWYRLFAASVLFAVALSAPVSGYCVDVGHAHEWVKLASVPCMVEPIVTIAEQPKPSYTVRLDMTSAGRLPEVAARCRSPGEAAANNV